MTRTTSLAYRFFTRLLTGLVPLALFCFAYFEKGTSGNNGNSLNFGLFIPAGLFFGWLIFLLIQALYFFFKTRVKHGLMNIYAGLLLISLYILILYIKQTL